MKNLLALALLLSGVAQADEFTAGPLKGIGLCALTSGSIAVSSTPTYLPATFKLDLATLGTTKLNAYRITKNGQCGASPLAFPEVDVILTDALPSGARGYAIVTKIWRFERGGAIDLWSSVSAGVSNESALDLAGRIQQAVGDQLDRLAADYALANP
ncbi:hypothetical protein [Deinococcus sp. Leaf326]|uniref:hypothetical protein n=1 Tax=Deinococcus sp. Leaf326 TaxID=1736338 RepID=UPI0006FE8E1F|nr:hypothetical protein [Deinococcus sp. Leaf326]KQR22918.1 hypothetical protein ASF71_07050 [Deinococcus sp. Leaf326]